MKKATPIFYTPTPLKWIFGFFLLLPIGMMSRNAYVLLEGKNEVLVGEKIELLEEKGQLHEEIAALKESNLALGETVDGLEGALAQAKLENERLLAVKSELVEEIDELRLRIGYHESREDSLQRVIDLLKGEIVAYERKIDQLKRENQLAARAFQRMGAGEVADAGGGITPELVEQNYFELVKANEKLAKQAEMNDRQALELLTEISELNTELNQFKNTQEELKGTVAQLNQELFEKRAVIDAIALRQSE